MTNRIQVLSEEAINKIAAGEVVENPSSVVKELVDNALDAGAREIAIHVVAGGRQLIRVVDDGCGMGRDDALLSLERHATSKIRSAEDLDGVTTMGFRGEAVPSIAGVSKFSLLTSEGGEGTKIVVDGGKILSCNVGARAKGTTVEVRSLFFNVPVRRKFQKSVAYDAGEIHRVVARMALAHSEVRFELTHGDKVVLSAKSDERVIEVLGEEFASTLVPIEESEGEVAVRGWIGKVVHHRPNRLGQYLFINGRPVLSQMVSEAVREGYGVRLPERRFPLFVLHLDLPGEFCDVNVHPQKKLVRLRQEALLKQVIGRAIGKALDVKMRAPEPVTIASAPMRQVSFAPPPEEVELPLFEIAPTVLAVFSHFALIEKDGLSLVDLQASSCALIYEGMKKEKPESQALLVPITLHATPLDDVAIDELQAMGVGIRSLGGGSFLIDALPPKVRQSDVEELLHDPKQKDLALNLAMRASKRSFSKEDARMLLAKLPEESPQGKKITVPISEKQLLTFFE